MTAPQARDTEHQPVGTPKHPDAAAPTSSPASGAATATPPTSTPAASTPAPSTAATTTAARPTPDRLEDDTRAIPTEGDDGKVRRPGPPRPAAPRAGAPRGNGDRPPAPKTAAGRTRKARLALKRIDPWSVFLFSLLASVFAGVALIVAVFALFTVLDAMGVVSSVNELVTEVTGEGPPLLTTSRLVGGASVLAAANVVLLTLLATLGALLYNVCASFTGGVELTLGERDG